MAWGSLTHVTLRSTSMSNLFMYAWELTSQNNFFEKGKALCALHNLVSQRTSFLPCDVAVLEILFHYENLWVIHLFHTRDFNGIQCIIHLIFNATDVRFFRDSVNRLCFCENQTRRLIIIALRFRNQTVQR